MVYLEARPMPCASQVVDFKPFLKLIGFKSNPGTGGGPKIFIAAWTRTPIVCRCHSTATNALFALIFTSFDTTVYFNIIQYEKLPSDGPNEGDGSR